MNDTKVAPTRVTASSGVAVSGEMLAYSASGSPVSYSYIDAAGNMNLIYTPAVAQNTPAHTLVQWKGVRAMVAVPTPAVSMPASAYALNAGGVSLVITGVNLAETSAAKKVTGVKVGTSTLIVPAAGKKTATSITVAIPSATAAGVSGTPTAAQPSMAPVTLVLGSGSTISAGTVTYVGATKVPQTTTIRNLTTTSANVPAGDRPFAMTTTTTIQGAPTVEPIPTASPSSVCTIVTTNNVPAVHFEGGAGTCTVTATSATNDWLAQGQDVKTISVLKTDSVTSKTLGDGVDANVSASADNAVIPTITLASGREVTITRTVGSTSYCTVTDGAVQFLAPAGHVCVVHIHADADSTWTAVDEDWNITTVPAIGESAESPSAGTVVMFQSSSTAVHVLSASA
jgi:hypothetical protein